MRTKSAIVATLIFVVSLVGLAVGLAEPAEAQNWQAKVDAWVLETAAAQGQTEFLVYLAAQADVRDAAALETKLEKGTYVFEQLTAVASSTQGPVIDALQDLGAEYRPYWVVNMIWVRGDLSTVEAMAARSDVARIYANPWVKLDEPATDGMTADNPSAIEWNVLKINADDVWALGYTGQGTVVGGQDTGYDWDHPALINQYRGWDGTADHNYNWHDAIHENNPNTPPGNICGFDSPVPCDDNGHGTHTMGTMVGDDGGANQIGVAPGAEWISCRNMEEGWGTPATYAECYEWFIAPTDLNDQNPDPSLAPDAINNSWGCPAVEGCTDPNVLLTVVDNVRAAGILTAHSAGNSGSSCSSVNTPAAIYDASYSVGATDSGDNIAGFSSRGPVAVDGSNRLKPDISAPGVSIRSSIPGGGYAAGWSGTSMAAPHVAAVTALIISADPSLAGDVDELENITNATAVPRTSAQTCGGVPGTNIPNNTYGYGRIDALAAVLSLGGGGGTLSIGKDAPPEVAPGHHMTYTLEVGYEGTEPAIGVVVTDVIPIGTMFVSATGTFTQNGDEIIWTIGDMNGGETASVDLVVAVPLGAVDPIVNALYGAAGANVPPVTGTPVTTEVVPFDVQLVKSASTGLAFPGDWITYTLVVTNSHPFAAVTGLVLTDVVPLQTTFVSASGTYTQDGDEIQWQAEELAAGDAWEVTLTVEVDADATGTIVNDSYAVWTDETGFTYGPAVATLVDGLRLYLPAVIAAP